MLATSPGNKPNIDPNLLLDVDKGLEPRALEDIYGYGNIPEMKPIEDIAPEALELEIKRMRSSLDADFAEINTEEPSEGPTLRELTPEEERDVDRGWTTPASRRARDHRN